MGSKSASDVAMAPQTRKRDNSSIYNNNNLSQSWAHFSSLFWLGLAFHSRNLEPYTQAEKKLSEKVKKSNRELGFFSIARGFKGFSKVFRWLFVWKVRVELTGQMTKRYSPTYMS